MIFYFTGTGNSQYTAEEIAKATGEKAIHIGSLVKSRKFSYTLEENERLGFVFPVYFGGIPNIITWFIKKLELTGTPAFTYAVITCGGSPIASDHMLKEKLAARDMTLDAVYELKMPDNYVLMYNLPTEEEADKELEAAEPELRKIIDSILVNNEEELGAKLYESGLKERAMTAAMYPFYVNGRKTDKFWTDDQCVGCGICASRCPVGAIELINKKPTWVKDRCVHCLGCMRCGAIQFGPKTPERNRYKHPIFRKKKGGHSHH